LRGESKEGDEEDVQESFVNKVSSKREVERIPNHGFGKEAMVQRATVWFGAGKKKQIGRRT
jgi:hypothetical protein